MTAIELDRVEERMGEKKEPAKAWRNKWQASQDADYVNLGFIGKGSVIWGLNVHPSREIAEQIAHEDIAAQIAEGWTPDEYLGAFPVTP